MASGLIDFNILTLPEMATCYIDCLLSYSSCIWKHNYDKATFILCNYSNISTLARFLGKTKTKNTSSNLTMQMNRATMYLKTEHLFTIHVDFGKCPDDLPTSQLHGKHWQTPVHTLSQFGRCYSNTTTESTIVVI